MQASILQYKKPCSKVKAQKYNKVKNQRICNHYGLVVTVGTYDLLKLPFNLLYSLSRLGQTHDTRMLCLIDCVVVIYNE